jgi:integrase
VRPTTQERYTDLVDKHINPIIGYIQLAKLTPLDIQRLYADRLSKGKLSPTTVGYLHCILRKALKQGMQWGLLTRNVTEAVDRPRRLPPEYTTWNKQQVTKFLAVVDDDELAALWRLALLTGMRRGGILDLKWENLDLARGVLAVKQTLIRENGGHSSSANQKQHRGIDLLCYPGRQLRA